MTVVLMSILKTSIPFIVNTWPFKEATMEGWVSLEKSDNCIDAVERCCVVAQEKQCDGTVGFGGSPDENGETTLDALIMDGITLNIGSVVDLRRIKNAVGVARGVLDRTKHSIMAGDGATNLAKKIGFVEESLSTEHSIELWKKWKNSGCIPNFWIDKDANLSKNQLHHDTVGVISSDSFNNMAVATSTNGAIHKIPGRVADSAVPGAGAYVDNEVGAAVCTGDGDYMLRFCPSFLAVESLRNGMNVLDAATSCIKRMKTKMDSLNIQLNAGIIVADNKGNIAAACCGFDTYGFTLCSETTNRSPVFYKVDKINE